jgi:ABC-2 type transport system permease protein
MALGLGLAGVGGTMLPLELLSEPMRRVARFTPHAGGYARRGVRRLRRLPQLGVLAAFAVVLFGLGVWRLRRSITG